MKENLPHYPERESNDITIEDAEFSQNAIDYQIVINAAMRLSVDRKADRMKPLTAVRSKGTFNPIRRALRNRHALDQ